LKNLTFMTVALALLFTAGNAHGQFFQTEPNHSFEAAFRTIDRPDLRDTSPVVINGNTGGTILRVDDATDLNSGLGVDLDYVFKTQDNSQYEIRGFFTDWETHSARTGSDLRSPFIPGVGFRQFDVNYQSEMYNLEMNRRQDIFNGASWLVGVRYMALNEQVDFVGTGFVGGPGGALPLTVTSTTEARNPMLGLQMGGEGRVYLVHGVHLEFDGKAALFSNSARQTSAAFSNFTAPAIRQGSNNDATTMLEYSVRLHYDLLVNKCSMFVGYEGMYLSGVAIAPRQIPTGVLIDDNDNLYFNGISVGLAFKR